MIDRVTVPLPDAPPRVTVTVPTDHMADAVRDLPGVRVVVWNLVDPLEPATRDAVELVVVPDFFVASEGFRVLHDLPRLRVVQLPSAGVEHALPHLPAGLTVCNGRGVHSDETAELAVGLALASLRGIDDAVRAQDRQEWSPRLRPSLADRRAVVVGAGSIGTAVLRRLEAFAVHAVRVGTAARDDEAGHVHGVDELPRLLADAEVVVVTVPLTPETDGMLDAGLLARLPDGALLVNVARGKVVDTDALLAELVSGRLRAALDVTDPEPLPAGHPLWSAPGLLLTPHVGGNTTATPRRMAELVRAQLERLVGGEPLENVVAQT